MSVLSTLQFRRKRPADHPAVPAAPSRPTTEGWHPDLSAGTLRYHGPGGTPTDRLAKWHD